MKACEIIRRLEKAGWQVDETEETEGARKWWLEPKDLDRRIRSSLDAVIAAFPEGTFYSRHTAFKGIEEELFADGFRITVHNCEIIGQVFVAVYAGCPRGAEYGAGVDC